jgi:3-oxoacyl-[acyl-carrier protein] reductase
MKPIALISGGSSGLGKAIAQAIKDIFTVVIFSNQPAQVEAACKEVGAIGMVADLTDTDSLQNLVEQVVNNLGGIDVLINNAGVWNQGELQTVDATAIERTMQINATGNMQLTRLVVPHMLRKQSGSVLFVNSENGLIAEPERSVYNASKWALTGFAKCLQTELSGKNIKVMSIHPGLMHTELFKHQGVDRSDMNEAFDPNLAAQAVKFMLTQPGDVYIPSLEIKSLKH